MSSVGGKPEADTKWQRSWWGSDQRWQMMRTREGVEKKFYTVLYETPTMEILWWKPNQQPQRHTRLTPDQKIGPEVEGYGLQKGLLFTYIN